MLRYDVAIDHETEFKTWKIGTRSRRNGAAAGVLAARVLPGQQSVQQTEARAAISGRDQRVV